MQKPEDETLSDSSEEQNEKQNLIIENEKTLDLEKQADTSSGGSKQNASTTATAVMLAVYFAMNVGLTLYNKKVLGSFAFPWILTAVHTGSASLGSGILLQMGHFELTRLSSREHLVLFMFSLLFTLNIAMSNVSLALVSVPFHQIVRATCPLFTILIYRVFFSRRYGASTYLSLVPVIGGVGFATYGDYHFTTIGLVLTIAGVVLAAIKTVATNRLLTGRLRLGTFEVLLRMGPLAAVQSLLYSVLIGEFADFVDYVGAGQLTPRQLWAVAGNGVLAFGLNVASFQANKMAGALSMTVCANLKQCLTVALGTVLWDVQLNAANGAGILLALAGAAWYSAIELQNKRRAGLGA